MLNEIDKNTQEIIDSFAKFTNWEDSYREIIKIGKTSGDIDSKLKVDKYIVKGCQSQVWLIPSYKDGKVHFIADSDAFIVKGIVNLLCQVYSGQKPSTILAYQRDFLKEIGITEHLSMNRTNGLASMHKQIKMYAIAYNDLYEKGIMDLS